MVKGLLLIAVGSGGNFPSAYTPIYRQPFTILHPIAVFVRIRSSSPAVRFGLGVRWWNLHGDAVEGRLPATRPCRPESPCLERLRETLLRSHILAGLSAHRRQEANNSPLEPYSNRRPRNTRQSKFRARPPPPGSRPSRPHAGGGAKPSAANGRALDRPSQDARPFGLQLFRQVRIALFGGMVTVNGIRFSRRRIASSTLRSRAYDCRR